MRIAFLNSDGFIDSMSFVGYDPSNPLQQVEVGPDVLPDWVPDGHGGFMPPPAPPPPVPAPISRRQLLIGLKGLGLITPAEALAAAESGARPAAIEAYFSALPEDVANDARITWASMSICERNHPLVAALAEANQLSSEQIDDAFRAWALL